MTSLALLTLVLAQQPEVQIDCPGGTHFVKDKGCVANVAPKVECPGGTRFDGKKCVAIVDTSCPAGMHFVAGTGCVQGSPAVQAKADPNTPPPPPAPPAPAKKVAANPDAPPPPPSRPSAPAPEPENTKKGGTFSSGLGSDRLHASCSGATFDVYGGARLTGVRATLMANGTRIGNEEVVDLGQTKHITGKVGSKSVDLRITQAMFGTRYVLKVDGTECKLSK
ncbi:MAG: hypothetical protein JNM17_08785 [Archangium sp.]|nr:hypothetical protein [Archangium sp.]